MFNSTVVYVPLKPIQFNCELLPVPSESALSCCDEVVLMCWWVEEGSPLEGAFDGDLVLVSAWALHFFHFILLFWNQIFTCLSVRFNCVAISDRRSLVKKWLKWNSFSSSKSCFLVYAVLLRFPSVRLLQALSTINSKKEHETTEKTWGPAL